MKCWLLIGALMIATLANAQRPEVLPDCQSGGPIPFHVESQCGSGSALAQETAASEPSASSNATLNPWAFSLTTSGYIVPDDQSYVSPDFTADRGWLHLEARYNEEALETGSLWVGYNFSAGKKLVLDATPMVGGVFGNLNGVAPGYLSLSPTSGFSFTARGNMYSILRVVAAAFSTVGTKSRTRC